MCFRCCLLFFAFFLYLLNVLTIHVVCPCFLWRCFWSVYVVFLCWLYCLFLFFLLLLQLWLYKQHAWTLFKVTDVCCCLIIGYMPVPSNKTNKQLTNMFCLVSFVFVVFLYGCFVYIQCFFVWYVCFRVWCCLWPHQ